MLDKDFVDMTLEFTVALPEEERAKFTAFRLTETPDYSLAYFACGRDAQSVRVLGQLNRAGYHSVSPVAGIQNHVNRPFSCRRA